MESTLVSIFDKSYQLCDQIQFRDHERAAYEALCNEIFPGLSFEKWYKAGYWDSNFFNPHVLMDGDRIVSTASVNKMYIQFEKQLSPSLYIQIGGVMTASDCRKQGLSSFLIDKIITDYEDKCRGIYLFANDTVKDFYLRFGFKAVEEYQYSTRIKSGDEGGKLIRLNMDNKGDVERLLYYYSFGNPFSALKISNKGLLMFYAMKYHKQDIYYIEEEDAVVIAGYEDSDMIIYDIFSKSGNIKSLERILFAVKERSTEKIYFGFPLNKEKSCKIEKYEEEDNTLFILDKLGSESLAQFLDLPELHNKIMLPLLSHS